MGIIDVLRQPSLVAAPRPLHGLGNRVRVVLGARSLARLLDRRFFYTWSTGPQFGSRFDELWQVDDETLSEPAVRTLAVRFPFRDASLEWLDDRARAERVIQIRTPHALALPAAATPWEQELRDLRPAEEISSSVRTFFDANLRGRPYVGVMVRTHHHSHAETLQKSPIEWYLERMAELRSERPGLPFFVSADTPEGAARLSSAMPEVYSVPDKGDYNSGRALRSSVSDLYLLASSGHILAPHYSSFPELAQKLAGPGLALETSQTAPDKALDPVRTLDVVDDPTRPHLRHRAR